MTLLKRMNLKGVAGNETAILVQWQSIGVFSYVAVYAELPGKNI